MTILIGILFTLFSAVLALLVILGLPGIWLMIALAGIIDLVDSLTHDGPLTFGWVSMAIALGLALLSEVIEFAAGAAGAKATP